MLYITRSHGCAPSIFYALHTDSHLFEQESGRAGRDGLPAESVLYYATADRRSMDYLTQKGDKRQKKKRRKDDVGGQLDADRFT